eukprot:scaffold1362_cov163-Amphora_coffeaeformis.AAC.18
MPKSNKVRPSGALTATEPIRAVVLRALWPDRTRALSGCQPSESGSGRQSGLELTIMTESSLCSGRSFGSPCGRPIWEEGCPFP